MTNYPASQAFRILIGAKDEASSTIDNVGSRLGRVPGVVDKIRSAFDKLSDAEGLEKASKGVWGLASVAMDAARNFGMLNGAMGLAFGATSIAGQAALASYWGKNAVAASNAAQGIGIAAGRLRTLEGAAGLAGLSTDAMTSSLGGLATTLQDAAFGRNNEAAAMLSTLGITAKRTASGAWDLERAMGDIADAIAKQTNPQTQAKIAQMFGVEALLPMLRKGRAGFQAYVKDIERLASVSEETQKRSEELGISLNRLEAAASGVGIALEARLNTRFGSLINWMTEATAENKEGIATWIELSSHIMAARGALGLFAKLAGEGSIWARLSGLAAGPWGLLAAGAYAAYATAPEQNKQVVIRKETPEEKKAAEESWWPSWLPWVSINKDKSPDASPSPNAADNQPPSWWQSWLPNMGVVWKGQGAVDKAASGGAATPSAVGAGVRRWDPQIEAMAAKYGVSPDFVRRIMQQESGGRTHDKNGNPLTSSAGAIGPMQVMPGTYAEMARRYGIKGGITDPDANIEAGVAYLSEQMKRFGDEKAAAAAYNAGPGRVQKNINSGKPLPSETQNYVASIAAMQRQQPQAAAGGGEQKVNVTVTLGGNVPEGTTATAQTGAGTAVPARIEYAMPSFARP
ncbi:Transglycosylase SLT domain-containing protein [Azospirillum oryzae]|uniref:Transglycosylase SLT domain-containing protein n=1 Tax=Azospirillum oryzae TaxID=286727 RepID=A0A1X7F980_9PROT|nr:transglycosylase SLT domain-containing protein [Azospirillum oryzae]SMF48278.1 Transglycosylase SLT domain-containing protein [Azospirillum oryzae]